MVVLVYIYLRDVAKMHRLPFFSRLVCSDSMARGMDMRGVSRVVLYDAPSLIKTYIHRIGRTARAGESGTAYTLLLKEEVNTCGTKFVVVVVLCEAACCFRCSLSATRTLKAKPLSCEKNQSSDNDAATID